MIEHKYILPRNVVFDKQSIPADIAHFFEDARCQRCYICRLVAVFAEVRRVLRDDGTLWLNIGDSYAAGGRGSSPEWEAIRGRNTAVAQGLPPKKPPVGMKPKDLIGIPWLLAFALRADGWYLRQEIIWHKKNPMPESVTDRCTKAHESLFLLAKSERYYFDHKGIAEAVAPSQIGRVRSDVVGGISFDERGQHSKGGTYKKQRKPAGWDTGAGAHGSFHRDGRAQEIEYTETGSESRNKRSVWTVPTYAYPEAHFATFPPALIQPCILAGAPEGGTVLDPFAGSGTTLWTANRLCRHAIGIELSPAYVKLIEKRLAQGSLDWTGNDDDGPPLGTTGGDGGV